MILVTGGTGLVGTHLLYDLALKNVRVKALKRSNSNVENVQKVFNYYSAEGDQLFAQIDWVDGDVLDIFSLMEAMEDVKKVYHCAAMVSFSPDDREMMMKVNAEGTANVVNAALEKDIEKLCHVSSIAALGRNERQSEADEETHWKIGKHNSAYAISKYNAEREVWRGTAEGLDAVIVNPAIIIGPGDWNRSSVKMIKRVWDGLKFYTTGVNAFVDARDVSGAMIRLMESEVKNERFVLASENVMYRDFLFWVADSLNRPKPNIHANGFWSGIAWRVDTLRSWLTGNKPLITKETARTARQVNKYTSDKIRDKIGYEFIPVKQCVEDTCRVFLEEHRKNGEA